MPARLPYMQFYPEDWSRDTFLLSLQARGAWIDILGRLWFAKHRGTETHTYQEWGVLLRVDEVTAKAVITELGIQAVSDVTVGGSGDVTVSCRRMLRYQSEAEKSMLRVRKHRCNAVVTPPCNGHVTLESQSQSQSLPPDSPNPPEDNTPPVRVRTPPDGGVRVVKPAKMFVKPTLDEVRDYCIERKNGVEPEKWMAHYESNGWKVGRNPMKDWRAAVRTWERQQDTNQREFGLDFEDLNRRLGITR